jgi:hypothetical protein
VKGKLALAAIATFAMSACGSPDVADPVASTAPGGTTSTPGSAATVAVDTQVAPAPLPDTVAAFDADVMVSDVSALDLGAVNEVPGVQYSAALAIVPATVRDRDINVAVVDPETFRPLTPDETADAAAVWERLRDGDIVFTHAVGNEIAALLGSSIAVTGPRASFATRVGAYASNGIPPVADAVVNWQIGEYLGVGSATHILVAVDDSANVSEVVAAIEEATGGTAAVREKPAQQTAGAVAGGSLEPFTYVSVGDGTIRIDPEWVRRNIVTVDLPIFGRTQCHRVMVPQLSAALNEIIALGLQDLITDYSGCYVPRHMLWDPAKGISRHAWGLAFDINVPTNGYGHAPTLDSRIVDVFKRWGFKWGGDFDVPDGMHFELQHLITP